MKKWLVYISALFVIALDYLTKQWALLYLKKIGSIPIIKDFFHLTFVYNPGGAFGIFPNKKLLFIGVSILTIAIVLYYEKITDSIWVKLSLGFLLGGGIGNLIDRLHYGSVIDFIDVRAINWPVFNIADIFINLGVGMFIADLLIDDEEDDEYERE